jgi:hypothetical protein
METHARAAVLGSIESPRVPHLARTAAPAHTRASKRPRHARRARRTAARQTLEIATSPRARATRATRARMASLAQSVPYFRIRRHPVRPSASRALIRAWPRMERALGAIYAGPGASRKERCARPATWASTQRTKPCGDVSRASPDFTRSEPEATTANRATRVRTGSTATTAPRPWAGARVCRALLAHLDR